MNEEMQNQELNKFHIEEFSRVRRYMELAEAGTPLYDELKTRYIELKVILISSGINLEQLDRIKL